VVGDAPSCALLGGFAIGARVGLLWQHYGNAWQSPAVIHQAHRTPHALRMPAKTPHAGDKIDAPAACAVPFRPYCRGVVTRTRNVSEYMLVIRSMPSRPVVVKSYRAEEGGQKRVMRIVTNDQENRKRRAHARSCGGGGSDATMTSHDEQVPGL